MAWTGLVELRRGKISDFCENGNEMQGIEGISE
jgi:hypothetical protein